MPLRCPRLLTLLDTATLNSPVNLEIETTFSMPLDGQSKTISASDYFIRSDFVQKSPSTDIDDGLPPGGAVNLSTKFPDVGPLSDGLSR